MFDIHAVAAAAAVGDRPALARTGRGDQCVGVAAVRDYLSGEGFVAGFAGVVFPDFEAPFDGVAPGLAGRIEE